MSNFNFFFVGIITKLYIFFRILRYTHCWTGVSSFYELIEELTIGRADLRHVVRVPIPANPSDSALLYLGSLTQLSQFHMFSIV